MPTTNLIDTIAAFIRDTDGNNRMAADTLGWKIAEHLTVQGRPVSPAACAAFVREINDDKQMGAGRLAAKVADRFDLPY